MCTWPNHSCLYNFQYINVDILSVIHVYSFWVSWLQSVIMWLMTAHSIDDRLQYFILSTPLNANVDIDNKKKSLPISSAKKNIRDRRNSLNQRVEQKIIFKQGNQFGKIHRFIFFCLLLLLTQRVSFSFSYQNNCFYFYLPFTCVTFTKRESTILFFSLLLSCHVHCRKFPEIKNSSLLSLSFLFSFSLSKFLSLFFLPFLS